MSYGVTDTGGGRAHIIFAMFQQSPWGGRWSFKGGGLTIFSYLPVSASHRNRRTEKNRKEETVNTINMPVQGHNVMAW